MPRIPSGADSTRKRADQRARSSAAASASAASAKKVSGGLRAKASWKEQVDASHRRLGEARPDEPDAAKVPGHRAAGDQVDRQEDQRERNEDGAGELREEGPRGEKTAQSEIRCADDMPRAPDAAERSSEEERMHHVGRRERPVRQNKRRKSPGDERHPGGAAAHEPI